MPELVCNTSPIQYLESRESILVLDDALARRLAAALQLRLTGTLGVLLSAKRAGLIAAVAPALDRLQACWYLLPESANLWTP